MSEVAVGCGADLVCVPAKCEGSMMRNDRRPVPPTSAPASADGKRSNKVATQPLYLYEKLAAARGANEHECSLRSVAVTGPAYCCALVRPQTVTREPGDSIAGQRLRCCV